MLFRFFKKFVNVIFIVYVGMLFIMSLSQHCDINIYVYDQTKDIVGHGVFLYTLCAAIYVIGLVFTLIVLNKLKISTKTANILTLVLTAVGIVFCIVWVLFCESYPRFDQEKIYAEAMAMAGYTDRPLSPWYFTTFSRQRGMLFLMILLMKLFGPSVMSWRILNVIGYVAILVCIYCISSRLSGDTNEAFLTTAITFCFIPLIIYTSFQYGTILAIAFLIWGFYCILRFAEKPLYHYAILGGVFLTLGVQMHQSALIALVAAVIFLIINCNKRNFKKYMIGILIMLCIFMITSKSIDISYQLITGYESTETLPASATIYMGITSDNESGGPGAMNSTEQDLFARNNGDHDVTNKEAVSLIIETVKEYLNGERSIGFFREKIKYQWLEPSMGAQKNIYCNEPELNYPQHSDRYVEFCRSPLREISFRLLVIYMIAVYFMAVITGIYTLFDKDRSDIHFLIQLFFVGGFTFQLFWESLSRYCLSYYVLLMIEAGFGVKLIFKLLGSKKCIINENSDAR